LSRPGAFLSCTGFSSAPAGSAINAAAAAINRVRMILSLCVQCDVLHHIVVVAGRVEDELGRLALPELVDGVDHHRVLAFFRREIEGPRTERKATKVLTERRRGPRLSAISGDLHRAYAVAAIPGDAAHGQLAGIDFGTVTVAGDQRIYHH